MELGYDDAKTQQLLVWPSRRGGFGSWSERNHSGLQASPLAHATADAKRNHGHDANEHRWRPRLRRTPATARPLVRHAQQGTQDRSAPKHLQHGSAPAVHAASGAEHTAADEYTPRTLAAADDMEDEYRIMSANDERDKVKALFLLFILS